MAALTISEHAQHAPWRVAGSVYERASAACGPVRQADGERGGSCRSEEALEGFWSWGASLVLQQAAASWLQARIFARALRP